MIVSYRRVLPQSCGLPRGVSLFQHRIKFNDNDIIIVMHAIRSTRTATASELRVVSLLLVCLLLFFVPFTGCIAKVAAPETRQASLHECLACRFV